MLNELLSCLFYKIISNETLKCIHELNPPIRLSFRNPNSLTSFLCRKKYFYLPVCHKYNWKKLDLKTGNSTSDLCFRNALINFIRPSENKIFTIHDQVDIKLLPRLRLGFIRSLEHKFRHNFEDTINPLCSCRIEPGTTVHFYLCYQFYNIIQANHFPCCAKCSYFSKQFE